MPRAYEHSQHSLKIVGVEAQDLREWMDKPWESLVTDHRFLWHDPMDPPDWAVRRYGLETAKQVMQNHVNLDNFSLLGDLWSLELREIEVAEKEAMKNAVNARVRGIRGTNLLIECEHHSFKEGDPIAYVANRQISELGYVLFPDWYLSVVAVKEHKFRVGDKIQVCTDRTQIHRIQVGIIDRIKLQKPNMDEYAVTRKFIGREHNQQNMIQSPADNLSMDRKFVLDDSQIRVVEAILGLQEGEILTVVGPPGSGKTEVIAKAAHELSMKGERVLITSHTNRAVDNSIIKLPLEKALRLGRPERLLREAIPYTMGNKARTVLGEKQVNIEKAMEDIRVILGGLKIYSNSSYSGEDYQKLREEYNDLHMERSKLITEAVKDQLKNAEIVGCTLMYLSTIAKDQHFDTVLIDESSQVPILLAMLGMFKARKWVLIGDHNQLLPIFRTVRDKELRRRLSAFCYFKNRYQAYTKWLEWHYRSNDRIIEFTKKHVYDDRIRVHPSCRNIRLEAEGIDSKSYLSPDKPAVLIDVSGVEDSEGGSRFNLIETEAIIKILQDLEEVGVKQKSIGVITPFKAQCREIISRSKRRIETNTVDSFQGREKDLIIFSATSTRNMGFVEDINRVNVAFTRARKKLIVLGNARAIEKSQNILNNYIKYVSTQDAVFNYKNYQIQKSLLNYPTQPKIQLIKNIKSNLI